MKKLFLFVLIMIGLSSFANAAEKQAKAVFAGGCFWCMEPPFDKLPGVSATISGYAGGEQKEPTYEEVSAGRTGHAEVVQVIYDSSKVSYEKLLEVFWKNIDPTVANKQFCDTGSQYRTAIFYGNDTEKQLAEKTKSEVEKKLKSPVLTQIVPAKEFYRAEEYHQDFYKKNPFHYNSYRIGCGRDRRLKELWGG